MAAKDARGTDGNATVRTYSHGGGLYKAKEWPGEFRVLLYNFDINGTEPKAEWDGLIEGRICSMLANGCTATVLGLASTTYNSDWNFHLSRLRALNVANRITQHMMFRVRNAFAPKVPSTIHTGNTVDLATAQREDAGIRKVTWNGKDTALRWGVADHVESDYWRAALVDVWERTTPPPVTRLMDIVYQPDFPELGGSILPDALQWLDIASWIEGLVLADFIPFVDIALTIVDTFAALPAAWLTGEKLAYQNGEILGYNNAMQDMANAYADRTLDTRPESTWPPIPRPIPHYGQVTPQADGYYQQSQAGEKAGCDKAYKQVQDMDRAPKMTTLRRRDGRERNQRLTGKLWLHWLRLKYRGDEGVAGFMMSQWKDYMNSTGHGGTWPFHN